MDNAKLIEMNELVQGVQNALDIHFPPKAGSAVKLYVTSTISANGYDIEVCGVHLVYREWEEPVPTVDSILEGIFYRVGPFMRPFRNEANHDH